MQILRFSDYRKRFMFRMSHNGGADIIMTNYEQVKDLPDSYIVIDDPTERDHILNSIGIYETELIGCIFVKVGNAEYDEIYGISSSVPYLDSYLELMYSNPESTVQNNNEGLI